MWWLHRKFQRKERFDPLDLSSSACHPKQQPWCIGIHFTAVPVAGDWLGCVVACKLHWFIEICTAGHLLQSPIQVWLAYLPIVALLNTNLSFPVKLWIKGSFAMFWGILTLNLTFLISLQSQYETFSLVLHVSISCSYSSSRVDCMCCFRDPVSCLSVRLTKTHTCTTGNQLFVSAQGTSVARGVQTWIWQRDFWRRTTRHRQCILT